MTGGVGHQGHVPGPTVARGTPPGRRGLAATAAMVAGGLLAAVGLSACSPDVARADTVVSELRAATLTLADGSTSTPRAGTVVPRGATVTTAPGGSATLTTAGRAVLLGSDTAVVVLDGRREQLRRGLVMVDARRVGDLQLDAGAATVTTPRGALTRVERGVLLRVASFRATVDVRAAGRKATARVPGLRQVQVPYGALPGRVTALGLTRDAWERRYARDLVTDDIDLSRLADGLDRDTAAVRAVTAAVPASFGPPVAPSSEPALAYLLAAAARAPGAAAFDEVRRLRDEGGSWGVVAALVGADVAAVSAALDALVTPVETALALRELAADGAADVPVTGAAGAPVAAPGPAPRPGPPGGPRPSRSPSPSPTRSPDPVRDTVDEVVRAVVSALPVPLPVSPPPLVSGLVSP